MQIKKDERQMYRRITRMEIGVIFFFQAVRVLIDGIVLLSR